MIIASLIHIDNWPVSHWTQPLGMTKSSSDLLGLVYHLNFRSLMPPGTVCQSVQRSQRFLPSLVNTASALLLVFDNYQPISVLC